MPQILTLIVEVGRRQPAKPARPPDAGSRPAASRDVGRPVAERDRDRRCVVAVAAARSSSTSSPGCLALTTAITSSMPVDRLAVDRGDHVAAGADLLAADRDRCAAALDARLVGGAARDDLLDQGALVDREVEHVGELGVDVGAADPEEGVLDLAALEQLLGDVAGGVDRAPRSRSRRCRSAAAGLDLGVDPDHPARRRRAAARRSCRG